MDILVDGKIKELTVIDKNDVVWMADFIDISNRNEFKWNDEKDMYETDSDTFEWWSDMAHKQNKITSMELLLSDEDAEKYRNEPFVGDLEDIINQQLGWLEDNIEAKEQASEREAHMKAPLFMYGIETARSLGETGLAEWRASHKENKACRNAIVEAKRANTEPAPYGVYFDAKKTVNDVLNKGISLDRLGYIIATQVIRNERYLNNPQFIDGRFSNKVKDWALNTINNLEQLTKESFPFRSFEDCDLTSDMHHTLVNSLAEKFIDKQIELDKAKEEKKPEKEKSAEKPSAIKAIEDIKSEQKSLQSSKPAPAQEKKASQELE